MENKKVEMMIDGKKYEAVIGKEIKEEIKRTGYERVGTGEEHYYKNYKLNSNSTLEEETTVDAESFNAANYISDEELSRDIARADLLMSKLRRFAVIENAKTEMVDWSNARTGKYCIEYDYDEKTLSYNPAYAFRGFGQVYFSTKEGLEKAIEEFKEELNWYFTEYKDHLQEG